MWSKSNTFPIGKKNMKIGARNMLTVMCSTMQEKTGNVLHKVGCWHLNVPSRKGTYTIRYDKYCSDDVTAISAKADEKSRPYD